MATVVSSSIFSTSPVNLRFDEATESFDADAVLSIYTPPHDIHLSSLYRHAEKISQLKKDPNVMGITFAIDKNNNLVPVYLLISPYA